MIDNYQVAIGGKLWSWRFCPVLLLGSVLMFFYSTGIAATQSGPVDTVLFGTVFGDLYDPKFLTSRDASADVKARVRNFQKRAKAFRSQLPQEKRAPGPEQYTHDKKIQLERGMVALIPAPGIAQQARDFALTAPLAYEWEGMSDGPLAEAEFAEQYLESHSRTPLAPYLKLFLAHRQRCAFETLTLQRKEQAAIQAAKKYRTYLASALTDPDPLVRFIAADFEKRPFLYLKTGSDPSKAATREEKSSTPRCETTITGKVKKGEAFERTFGPGLIFSLQPTPLGWTITVRERGRDEDLSRLTPPFHFVPNPRDLEGWHFRNADNTGLNEAGAKNVNAPGEEREFIFSPEVGRSIQGADAKAAPTEDEVEKVRAYGRGLLKIIEYRLNNLEVGQQAGFEWIRFEVTIYWPDPPLKGTGFSCEPAPK